MDSDGFWWILVDSGGFWWILFPLVSISCRSHFDLSATVACVHWLPVLTGCLRSMVACVHWMPAFTGCLRSLVACVHWLPAFAGCLCSLVACVHWLPVFTWFPNGSVKKLLGILCWDHLRELGYYPRPNLRARGCTTPYTPGPRNETY